LVNTTERFTNGGPSSWQSKAALSARSIAAALAEYERRLREVRDHPELREFREYLLRSWAGPRAHP